VGDRYRNCGAEVYGREIDSHVWLMQPEVQTTTRGFLVVSAGALEIANVIQGTLEVFWLYVFIFH